MVRVSLLSMVLMTAATCGAVAQGITPSVFEAAERPIPENQIDRLVFKKLSALGIEPVLCSDAVFVRRVFLDVIGKLPTAAEAAQFINDPDRQNKRGVLIDQLLERNEYADYWSMKWGDALRIKAEFPVNLWPDAAQAYHRWVRASLVKNKPYDQFARELLTSSGSNFRKGPVNFYRAMQNKTPEGIAEAVALTFMGARAEEWPTERLAGLAGFFTQVGYKPTAEWKEEFVFWDPLKSASTDGNSAPGQAVVTTINFGKGVLESKDSPAPADLPQAVFPDGTPAKLSADRDPREVFADWLITPENPWFARNAANRVWMWLIGRGIVHEPDDFREDNPPSNPELLDWLGNELVSCGYDLKHLSRLILNSATYQLSSVPQFDTPEAERQFAAYPVRRLEAEVLIDAINEITGTSDLYTSAIPEPFTYLPEDMAAVAIADGSITSPFLALFGRSARATGLSNERDNQILTAQYLHLLNSSHIQDKLERGPALRRLINTGDTPKRIIEKMYLTILSRYPTQDEVTLLMDYGSFAAQEDTSDPTTASSTNDKKRKLTPQKMAARAKAAKAWQNKLSEEWVDIAWVLINSPEFLYRH